MCLLLSSILSATAPGDSASLVFAAVFVIVWCGAAAVTINAQLLGGTISFFQSVCILGYCVFPLTISSIICLLLSFVYKQVCKVFYVHIYDLLLLLLFLRLVLLLLYCNRNTVIIIIVTTITIIIITQFLTIIIIQHVYTYMRELLQILLNTIMKFFKNTSEVFYTFIFPLILLF